MEISSHLDQEIQRFLHTSLDSGTTITGVTPLNGDASGRRYFRISLEETKSDTEKSLILMKSFKPETELTPFLDVQRILKKIDVPVPEIFSPGTNCGLLLEEDCGDMTLESFAESHSEKETESLYKEAVNIIVRMQFNQKHPALSSIAYRRCFDTSKLLEELNFMMTHLLQTLSGVTVTESDMIEISAGFKLISNELSNEPRVFTHRDYHSRNIMVQENGKLKIIDFQDARMGPCQYDLVSLLRDSYSPLSPKVVNTLIEHYLRGAEEKGVSFDKGRFAKIFDYMTAQRSLKAAGTFAFQKGIRKNSSYMAFIRPALKMAFESMERNEELLPLKNSLFEHVKHLL